MWGENFQSLSDTFKLVMLDTLGFGKSPKPEISYSLDDHLSAIKTTVDSLGVTAFHVVGHSAGALLALAYADRFRENAGKLVLLSLPVYRSEEEARQAIKNSSLFNRWLALDTPLAHFVCRVMCALRPILRPIVPMFFRDVPAGVAKDALSHTWTSYSKTMRNVIFSVRAEMLIGKLKKPLLLIHGTKDHTAPIAGVRRIVTEHPELKLIELEAEHGIIFTHSSVIAGIIRNHLFL